MPTTYNAIATTTLSSSASTITFNSIPATYTDIRIQIIPVGATGGCRLQFNGDTGTNYSRTALQGTGTTTNTDFASTVDRISLEYYGMDATEPSFYAADIFSYAGSTLKTLLGTASERYTSAGTASVRVGMWRSTSAITRLDLYTVGTAFQAGTTATLFGIKAA